MKKSIVSYNNIKLSKTTQKTDVNVDQNGDLTSSNTKRLIFKTKISKPILTESKQTTSSDNTQPVTKNKIKLKRTLHENTKDVYNNSFDESEDDDFNVFDLNKKTSQLCIKKHKNDTSPSSSSTSSFSSSFINNEISPKVVKISPNKTKKIDLKCPDSDEETVNVKKIKVIDKKPEVKEERVVKKEFDIETKLKQLDDDEDFDKIKKFKLIKKTVVESKPETTISNEKTSCVVIKNKIFNSKSRTTNDSCKKLSSFKLNFNDYEENPDTDDESSKVEVNKKTISLVKTNSLQTSSQSDKVNLMPRSSSMNCKSDLKDGDASIMIVNTRKAYECEELGEAQAFQDDFYYLIDGLNSKYRLGERCLSSIKLAECCKSSEFRMNLRSSVSNDDYYAHKIFKLLNDSTKYKSLSLCTSLIMFALTQDKLSIDIDNITFSLLLSFLNNTDNCNSIDDFNESNFQTKFSYLNDFASKTSSPQVLNGPSDILSELNSNDTNDDCFVYKKTYSKCKKLYDDLNSIDLTNQNCLNDDLNFNCNLLTLDCLLNMNQNMKKTIVLNEFYMNELRSNFVLDKILIRCKLIVLNLTRLRQHGSFDFVHNDIEDNFKCIFLLNKLKSCINLLETVTQPAYHASLSSNSANSNNKNQKIKSIKYTDEAKKETKIDQTNILNQNYLIDLKDNFLIEMIKESMKFFYEQIDGLIDLKSKIKSSNDIDEEQDMNTKLMGHFINTLKEYFLFLISLTQNNEHTSKKLANDKEFIDLLFKFLLNDSKKQSILFKLSNENDQFDMLIMLLGVLLNILVNCFKQKSLVSLIKYKNKETGLQSIEIILRLYHTKEALVRVAENDQEHEFNQLNEHIESQNIENINVAIMNSIHKAGKHMEDHIIAAHSALIIGYMMLNDEYLNSKNAIDCKSIKPKLKDKSFKYMTQIIRKFIVFMKMMKVTGFSADEHVEVILSYLERLDD